MNEILTRTTAMVYRRLVRPVLFRQKPDAVHARTLRTAAMVQRAGFVRAATHGSWAFADEQMLGQTICGIHFANPIGLSAGFDKNFQLPPMMRAIGFGFMEGGSVTLRPCAGNARPWFYRLPRSKSLVVHVGLANDGIEAVAGRLGERHWRKQFPDFPINISVARTNSPQSASDTESIADYVGSLCIIRRADMCDMVTLNISCPNTFGGEPFTTPRRLDRLLREVDTLDLRQPVFVKMPHDLSWKQLDALLRVIASHRVAGVTISNLAKRTTALELHDPLPDSILGGLSGKPTWQHSNELIRLTYQSYGQRLVIIGVGGVSSAEDAYTKIRLGASLVELITGMIFEGPQLIGQINRGLSELLQRDGFANVSEAIGVDARPTDG